MDCQMYTCAVVGLIRPVQSSEGLHQPHFPELSLSRNLSESQSSILTNMIRFVIINHIHDSQFHVSFTIPFPIPHPMVGSQLPRWLNYSNELSWFQIPTHECRDSFFAL